MQLVDKLIYYMQYPFVKYALVVGILIALCSSLFGATLVLKRFHLLVMVFLMWHLVQWL